MFFNADCAIFQAGLGKREGGSPLIRLSADGLKFS
jgi:hypothetical protein